MAVMAFSYFRKTASFLEGLHCHSGTKSCHHSPEDGGDGNEKDALKRLILPWPHVPLLGMISDHVHILRRILVPA